jgi:hypothetical protein
LRFNDGSVPSPCSVPIIAIGTPAPSSLGVLWCNRICRCMPPKGTTTAKTMPPKDQTAKTTPPKDRTAKETPLPSWNHKDNPSERSNHKGQDASALQMTMPLHDQIAKTTPPQKEPFWR